MKLKIHPGIISFGILGITCLVLYSIVAKTPYQESMVQSTSSVSQKKTELATDWKSYNSDQYLSFRYPDNWEVTILEDSILYGSDSPNIKGEKISSPDGISVIEFIYTDEQDIIKKEDFCDSENQICTSVDIDGYEFTKISLNQKNSFITGVLGEVYEKKYLIIGVDLTFTGIIEDVLDTITIKK